MTYQISKWLRLAAFAALLWQTSAWLNGEDFSRSFEECFTIREKTTNSVPYNKGTYEQYCTDLLLPKDESNKRIGNFTEHQMAYIQELFRKVYHAAYIKMTHRYRRSAEAAYEGPGYGHSAESTYIESGSGSGYDKNIGQVPTRTEIRAFNGANFFRYAAAIQRIKKSGEYDVIAAIHGTVVVTAHFGPNLLPWHRLYLMVVEAALGVPIPYWDSSVDAFMKDPTKSVVWTKTFFGNGVGKVVTGPFANFATPAGPLFRKIGATGALLERLVVYNIWTKGHLYEISTPTATDDSNAEGQHNNVHAWVNGIMGNIAISSYDPIFFCFHSHLDFVWEIFRAKQASRGVNAEFDTVKTKMKGQRPEDPSGIKGLRNIVGYLQKTSKIATYRMWAQCSYCDGNKYVYCDYNKRECVSQCINRKPYTVAQLREADRLARESGLASGKFGPPFRPFRVDWRTRGDPVQKTIPVM